MDENNEILEEKTDVEDTKVESDKADIDESEIPLEEKDEVNYEDIEKELEAEEKIIVDDDYLRESTSRKEVLIYTYDDDKKYTGAIYVYVDELDEMENYTLEPVPEEFNKAIWDGDKWVEDTSIDFSNMLIPDFGGFDTPAIVFEIIKMLKKGGVEVNNNFAFQYTLWVYVTGQVEESYVDGMVACGGITQQQAMIIKSSKKMN